MSPLPNAVTAQGTSRYASTETNTAPHDLSKDEKSIKLGRQLSINSHGNHYTDVHRQEAERALNGTANNSGLISPPYHKESFFSHLRKKARRLSGRHGIASPNADDVEATAGAPPWSNRSSIIADNLIPPAQNDFADLDKALASVRYSLDRSISTPAGPLSPVPKTTISPLKRTHSVQIKGAIQSTENLVPNSAPVAARTRRALQMSTHPVHHYETPEEADEMLDEAINPSGEVARHLDQTHSEVQKQRSALAQKDFNRISMPQLRPNNPYSTISYNYPTPSASAKRNGVNFDPTLSSPVQPLNINKHRSENEHAPSYWPTPPNEENDWARSAVAANMYAADSMYK